MMTRKFFATIITFIISLNAMAQKKEGREAIKQLCGCFSVTFNYAETFTNDTIKKHLAHPLNNKAVAEYSYPILETDTKVVIQHLLVIPDGKGTVIKHWREDWEYEQTDTWQYTNTNEWTKVKLPKEAVKGKWTQSVWEVTDAPRYTGTSEWVHTNNQTFWLNTTDSPLPRREFTKRSDYNILQRTNRIVVSPEGYLHEQDNKKIIRHAGLADSIQAEEKGYNHYVRLPESDCARAKDFWTKEKAAFWKDVVNIWDRKMNAAQKVRIENRLDGQFLFQELDEVQQNGLKEEALKKAMDELLSKYISTLQEIP